MMIPNKNSDYFHSNFWEKRYQNKNFHEWLGDYFMFADIFKENVSKTSSILILGCGNSSISEQLYDDGFHNINNIDISQSIIDSMSNHCEKCKKMQWKTMDCRNLTYPDEEFDVILEKATLDVFLVDEKSPWNISDKALESLKPIADEIKRVLKPHTGQFISITFSAPHFRQPLLEKIFENSLNVKNVHQLGKDFHFYLYHLTNNPLQKSIPYFKYQPPKISILDCFTKQTETHETDEINFLFEMNL